MDNQQRPYPSFEVVARAHEIAADSLHRHGLAEQTLAEEMRKCVNIPALDGHALVQYLEGMEGRLGTRIDGVRTELVARIDGIQTEMRLLFNSERSNSAARVHNARLVGRYQSLAPLRSANNDLIAGFPATPQELADLPEAEIDRLLMILELDLRGLLDEKQVRLKVHIGLFPTGI